MNENTTSRPHAVASGELTLTDIAAMAGPEFAEWLGGLFGHDVPRQSKVQPAAHAKA
jgi:hypothetical protein